jgi:Fe-S-cluster containining protein
MPPPPEEAARPAVVFKIEMVVGEHTLEASARVPDGMMRLADLLPILQAFDDAVVGVAADKVERAGRAISCRAGCGACCRQLVPISEAEAVHLAELVEAMPGQRRAALRGRFDQTLGALAAQGLLARLRRPAAFKTLAARRRIGKEYFQLGLPCPFLEEESCGVHPHRPLACREYLVTSAAENCRHPGPDTIEKVPLPMKFSEILYTFGDGFGAQATRWLPLVLAPEWAARRARRQPVFPGPQLFSNFLALVSQAAKQAQVQRGVPPDLPKE